MSQKFYASKNDTLTHPNGAIGYRPGGPMDCLGPYAKVKNCPVEVVGKPGEKTEVRLTCYASGYADTFFSVPANTRRKGFYVSGFFTNRDDGVVFVPHERFAHLFSAT